MRNEDAENKSAIRSPKSAMVSVGRTRIKSLTMVRSSYGFDVSRIAMQTIRRIVPWVLLLQY